MKLNLFLIALLLAVSFGCKRSVRISEAGYILGTDDILRFNQETADPAAVDIFNSTVLLSTKIENRKQKFCSGTLIHQPNSNHGATLKVLTNFHCFAKTNDEGKTLEEFSSGACVQTNVFLGFSHEQSKEVFQTRCKIGSLIGDYSGDLAIFELQGEIPAPFHGLNLWLDKDIPSGRDALVVHYPDIAENFVAVGKPAIKLPSATITQANCATVGDFSVEEWPLDHTLPYSLKHSCDLVHGSSGSALIDKETKKILGVNWGGIEIKYKSRTEKHNAATKGYYIAAFLNGETDMLKQDSQRLAMQARERREKENQQEKTLSAKTVQDTVCGTLGSSKTPSFLLFCLFLTPIIVAVSGFKYE